MDQFKKLGTKVPPFSTPSSVVVFNNIFMQVKRQSVMSVVDTLGLPERNGMVFIVYSFCFFFRQISLF